MAVVRFGCLPSLWDQGTTDTPVGLLCCVDDTSPGTVEPGVCEWVTRLKMEEGEPSRSEERRVGKEC